MGIVHETRSHTITTVPSARVTDSSASRQGAFPSTQYRQYFFPTHPPTHPPTSEVLSSFATSSTNPNRTRPTPILRQSERTATSVRYNLLMNSLWSNRARGGRSVERTKQSRAARRRWRAGGVCQCTFECAGVPIWERQIFPYWVDVLKSHCLRLCQRRIG